ncbi:MAG: bifunctional glutamate N-acetyltransferase/amino-acid acetyltransferase ArgJ [Thermoguttaceae bacterium]|jgi:glutamate N-acetyltransferase/amino-acid N-acetyltransferase
MNLCLPKGFKFAGIHCGVKPDTTKLDMALIVSDVPATAAGVYTRNLVCGAPVQLDRARTPGKNFRAIVVNSGVANACTGEEGFHNAHRMAEWAAKTVGADGETALVMSTGVIGVQLPMDKIESGIAMAGKELAATKDAFHNAARAIMTTDTVEKTTSRKITLSNGNEVVLTGMCKGAAMIGPNMATMLCVILTDASLLPKQAQDILCRAADCTFNCISVEGHTSTSDTVLLMANGMANPGPLPEADLSPFADALIDVCAELARMIPNDGEGVSHLITVHVLGCATPSDAKTIAKTIANDVLVKTAICGADPNWGRIVSAAGRAGVDFNPAYVSLKINGYPLYRDGTPVNFDKKAVSESIRSQRETIFELHFKEGDASARFWTSDLTTEYVHLNADYTT